MNGFDNYGPTGPRVRLRVSALEAMAARGMLAQERRHLPSFVLREDGNPQCRVCGRVWWNASEYAADASVCPGAVNPNSGGSMKKLAVLFTLALFLAPVLAFAGAGDIPPSFLVKLRAPYVGVTKVVPAGTICRVTNWVGGKVVANCGVGITDIGAEFSSEVYMDPADVETIYALPGTCQQ